MSPQLGAYDVFSFTETPVIVARTPLLPIEIVSEIYGSLGSLACERLARDPAVRAAIYTASKSLFDSIQIQNGSQLIENFGFVSYLLRSSSRCTPFALCSAVSLVNSGTETSLSIPGSGTSIVHVRPDMTWLSALLEQIRRDTVSNGASLVAISQFVSSRSDRVVILNPNVVKAPTNNTFVPDFAPVSIALTEAVKFLMSSLTEPITVDDAATLLAEHFSEPLEAAKEQIVALCDAGLLVDDLKLHPLDPDIAEGLPLDIINRAANAESIKYTVESLRHLSGSTVGATTLESLRVASAALVTLCPAGRSPLHVDMTRNLNGVLGPLVIEEARNLAEMFARSLPVRLSAFALAFAELYGNLQEEVPLLDLIDPLHGIQVTHNNFHASVSDAALESINSERFDFACNALRAGVTNINLTDADVSRLLPELRPSHLTPSFELGFEILARDGHGIDTGDFLLAPASYSGSTGALRSIGRFAWALGADARNEMQRFEALQAELDDAIRCELVVQPSLDRTLNVSIRPRTTAGEIRVGYEALQQQEGVITPRDILIGFNGERFYARDRRTGRVLRVVESHNLNIPNTAPIVGRFLSLLRTDGYVSQWGFDWGAGARLPVLPRLTYGRTILAPAQWRIRTSTLKQALMIGEESIRRLLNAKWVQFGQLDNKLAVDVETEIGRKVLLHHISKRTDEFTRLEELLATPDNCWLRDEGGQRYRSEFIISGLRSIKEVPTVTYREYFPSPGRDIYPPGSEWLYAKIYCAEEDVERFLVRHFVPLLDRLDKDHHWHFVRYRDPRFHVRIRVKHPRSPNIQEHFTSSFNTACRLGDAAFFVFDTYRPEINRYGGIEGLEICSHLFHVDSEEALRTCAIPSTPDKNANRMRECVRSGVALIWPALRLENGLTPLQFSAKPLKLTAYERAILRQLTNDLRNGWNPAEHVFHDRVCELIAKNDHLTRPPGEILNSVLHMHCNRYGMFQTDELKVRTMIFQLARSAEVLFRNSLR